MLTTIGLIIVIGMLAQWLSWKQKVPVIITLLLSGLLVGPLLGWLRPQEHMSQETISTLVELCVSLILFDGAMQLKLKEFKSLSMGLNRIMTLGVLIHFILISTAAYFIIDVSLAFSALLGGILIVTGPTVIIPAIREANINNKIAHYLKWEGILTDPVGAIVAVVVYDALIVSKESSPIQMLLIVAKICLVAFAIAFLLKYLLQQFLKKKLIPEFLQIPFITSLVICSFAFSNEIQHGAGLLTVTLLGILIGNSKIDILFNLRTFKENITTLSVSFVFIIITSSITFDAFKMITLSHIFFILLVTFILRTLAIMISTINSDMDFKEKLLIGSYGPRGIVAVSVAAALSSQMLSQGIQEGELFLPLVLLVVISTVIFHSLLLKPLSIKLKLESPKRNGIIFIGTMPWMLDLALKLQENGIPVLITSSSWYKLAPFRAIGVRTFYGQILNNLDHGDLDLNEFSSLLAMSENDSFNVLACEKFSKFLGAKNVFHLKRSRNFGDDKFTIEKENYSLLLNSLELRYEKLMRQYQYGWKFRDIQITKDYSYQDFLLDNENAIICFLISKDGEVHVGSSFDKAPTSGETLISFSPEFTKSNNLRLLKSSA